MESISGVRLRRIRVERLEMERSPGMELEGTGVNGVPGIEGPVRHERRGEEGDVFEGLGQRMKMADVWRRIHISPDPYSHRRYMKDQGRREAKVGPISWEVFCL